MDKNNISILIFYDEPGWAWWHRANQIKKNISRSFNIDIIKIGAEFNHNNYDLILLFEYYLYAHVQHVPCEKLIIGCSCPKTINLVCNLLIEKKCAAGIVNNNTVFQYAKNFYKFYNCPNGVDTHIFFPPKTIPKQLSACWVGNSKSMGNKGLEIIREACELTKIPLLAIDQHQNISKGNILSHIELRDTVYHKASFYICASEYEGTPNPALEALSCGLPVITTRVGNMPEIIVDGYNGYLIDRNIESLCEAIEKMKQSDLRSMSINARKSILNGWTWEQQSTRYSDAFQKIHNNSYIIHSASAPNTPLVSVIIPTFNRPQELIEAIESVRNQSFQNFEIIVVNDYGYDVSKLLNKIHDHRIIYKPHDTNKGLAAARNTGIKLARGKYIAYLDDDDQFYPDHLKLLVDFLENSEFKIAYTDGERIFFKEENSKKILINKVIEHSHDFDPIRLLINNYIPVLCIMHEKSCINNVGFFDENLPVHEDWDLWIRLSRIFPFKHIKSTSCAYHTIINKSNSLTTSRQLDFIKTMQIIYRKHKHITSTNEKLFFLQKKALFNLTMSNLQLDESFTINIDNDFNITIDDTQSAL